MPSPGNLSAGAAEPCVVSDQMGPFTVLYVLVLAVGLPGNLLSAWVFLRCPRAKDCCSVYLVNLLAADLLLLLALPFKVLKDSGVAPWGLVVFHCQASGVAIYIGLYASIAFLALIITDRYLQDCRSLQVQEVGFARLLSLVIWLLLLLIMVPNMALPIKQVQAQRYLSCSSLKQGISLHWHALTVFLCTALFLNASLSVLLSSGLALRRLLRSRADPEVRARARRVARSVMAVALAYVLSFVPYHAVRTPYTLAQANVITDCPTRRRLFLGKEATLLLSALHVGLDPLLFACLHAPFRRALSGMLPRGRRGGSNAADAAEVTQQQQQQQQQRPEDQSHQIN